MLGKKEQKCILKKHTKGDKKKKGGACNKTPLLLLLLVCFELSQLQ